MTGGFVGFVVVALAMMLAAIAFVVMPPLIATMRRRRQLADGDDKNGKDGDNRNNAADWRFALAAVVFVVAVAPGLYWLSGAPEALAPKNDAAAVVGILLSAAERAQQNGDDKNAALLRQKAQLILQSDGEQQLAIIRRLLKTAEDAAKGKDNPQQ